MTTILIVEDNADLAFGLRNNLERDPAGPRHILTVRKAGYRLSPTPHLHP